MAEDQPEGPAGVKPDADAWDTTFSGPAVLINQFLISEQHGVVRIGTAERDGLGKLHFRGAVALSLPNARELAKVLSQIIENAERGAGPTHE